MEIRTSRTTYQGAYIDLVSANILDKVPPADTRGATIAIAPLLAEEIFQLVFKEWKNKYNLTDQLDDQVKASLQAVFAQLAPIRQYFDDDQELKDFIRSKEMSAPKALGLFKLQQAAQQIILKLHGNQGGQALPEEALLKNAETRGALLKSSFLNVEKDNTSYPLCIQIPLSQNLGRQLKTTELSSVPSKRSNPWHTYLFKSNNAEADQAQSSHCLYVLPEAVDLSYWCSPVKDQGPINACTVNAVASLVEYFEKRSSNKDYRASRRFLYKVTRKIAVDTNNHYLDDISEDELKGFAKSPEETTLNRLKKLIGEVKLSHQPVSISVIQELVKCEKRDEFKRKLFDIGASIRHTLKALQLFGIPPERYWAYHTDVAVYFPKIDSYRQMVMI